MSPRKSRIVFALFLRCPTMCFVSLLANADPSVWSVVATALTFTCSMVTHHITNTPTTQLYLTNFHPNIPLSPRYAPLHTHDPQRHRRTQRPRTPESAPHSTATTRTHPLTHPSTPPLYIFNYFPNSPIRSTACLLASSSSDNCAAGRWFDPHKLPLPRRQRVTETLALAEKATDLVTRRILTNFGWVGCAFCQFGDLFGGDGRWGGRR
jgi:hypothetical protein